MKERIWTRGKEKFVPKHSRPRVVGGKENGNASHQTVKNSPLSRCLGEGKSDVRKKERGTRLCYWGKELLGGKA